MAVDERVGMRCPDMQDAVGPAVPLAIAAGAPASPMVLPHYTSKQMAAVAYAMSAALQEDFWFADEDRPAVRLRGPYSQGVEIRPQEIGHPTPARLQRAMRQLDNGLDGALLCKVLYSEAARAADSGALTPRSLTLWSLAELLGARLRTREEQHAALTAIRNWALLIGACYVDVASITNEERRQERGGHARLVQEDYVRVVDVRVTVEQSDTRDSTVTVTPTAWLLRHRARWYNQYLGDLRDVLARPGGRGCEAWTRVLDMNLSFLWRARVNRQETRQCAGRQLEYAPFARHELLGTPLYCEHEAPAAVLASHPTVGELAVSRNPGRMRGYLHHALENLVADGTIAAWHGVPHPVARVDADAARARGWVRPWLRQLLVVHPGPRVLPGLLAARREVVDGADAGEEEPAA